MNQLQAMRDTVALMERGIQWIAEQGDASGAQKMHLAALDSDLQPQHVRDMLSRMLLPLDTIHEFSDAKMGRWLGWAQAAVVAQGLGTLEDMKQINMRNRT